MGEETTEEYLSQLVLDSLNEALEKQDDEEIRIIFEPLDAQNKLLVLSRLNEQEQVRILSIIEPVIAAEVIEDVNEAQAADIIEAMPPEQAAAIVDEIPSDLQTDILAEMSRSNANEILENLPTSDANDVREMLSYPPFSAGGIMITEFLSFPMHTTVSHAIDDLRANREKYEDFMVRYVFVTDTANKLTGVLQMNRLMFANPAATLERLMIKNPMMVGAHDELEFLREFFKDNKLYGVPVTDKNGVLVGVVTPEAVEKAVEKKAVRQFLRLSGIVGGEEFRSMPLLRRSGRRLSWLTINILLNILAASVIAYFQGTLEAAIALAVFLPMISDMSGCSGNQAVAVSMRELTLGLVRPREILRVLAKEASLGLVNGAFLGLLLGGLAYFWKGNVWLGIVVGAALSVNTVVAVSFGGALPLVLKKLKLDPALVASPMLTTVTDMCGFFFVLGLASQVIQKIA